VLGVDPQRDAAVRDYDVVAGRALDGESDLLLSRVAAERVGAAVGDTIRLLGPTGVRARRVTGLLRPAGAGAANAGQLVVTTLPVARELFDLPAQITSLELVLAPEANRAVVEAAIAERLPDSLRVQPPAARGALSQDVLYGTARGMSVLSVVSLVAGAFVVLNAILMNLGERRRDFAILRALGTTRRQLTTLLLREAAMLGVVGTLLGIPLGLGLAVVLNQVIAEMLGVAPTELRLTVGPFLAAVLLGPGVALAATLHPTRRAARRSPLDGLRDGPTGRGERLQRWPGYAGLGILIAGVVFVLLLIEDVIPMDVAAAVLPACMAALCISAVLIVPLFLPALRGPASAILRRVLGIEGRLAARQLERHPMRTAITVGVLVMSIAVAIGYGIALFNSVDDIRKWAGNVANVDFFVRASWPDSGTMTVNVEMPADYKAALEKHGGIAEVSRLSFIPARVSQTDQPVIVMAHDITPATIDRLNLIDGEHAAVLAGLRSGDVVVGSVLARRLGLRVGDTIEIHTSTGLQARRIAGEMTEYSVGGMNLAMDWLAAHELFGFSGVHVFAVTARPDELETATTAVTAFAGSHGLIAQSQANFHAIVDELMAGVVASSFVILGLVFVVALLGMINTLTMNILEQTRELGILRAVAMQRGQLRRMIFGQALGVSLISLIPGALAGLGIAYLMNVSTYPLTGMRVDYHLQPEIIISVLAVAIVVGVAASWAPAQRAARITIASALQYE